MSILRVDGIHCGLRQDDNRLCILVVLGINEHGEKELVAIDDGLK